MREGIVKCKVKNLRNQSITVEVLTGEKLDFIIEQFLNLLFLLKKPIASLSRSKAIIFPFDEIMLAILNV